MKTAPLFILLGLLSCQNAPVLTSGLHRSPASSAEVEIVNDDEEKRKMDERLQTLHETQVMVQLNSHSALKVTVAREHVLVLEKELLALGDKKLLKQKALEFARQNKVAQASLSSLLRQLGVSLEDSTIGVYDLAVESRRLSKRPSFQSLVTTLEHKAHILSTKGQTQFFLTETQRPCKIEACR